MLCPIIAAVAGGTALVAAFVAPIRRATATGERWLTGGVGDPFGVAAGRMLAGDPSTGPYALSYRPSPLVPRLSE